MKTSVKYGLGASYIRCKIDTVEVIDGNESVSTPPIATLELDDAENLTKEKNDINT